MKKTYALQEYYLPDLQFFSSFVKILITFHFRNLLVDIATFMLRR